MKFSALNIDFNSPSLDLQEHQRAVPPKSCYLTVVGKSTMKTVADRQIYAAYHNKPWWL